jgi:hypothetical protein
MLRCNRKLPMPSPQREFVNPFGGFFNVLLAGLSREFGIGRKLTRRLLEAKGDNYNEN